MEAEWSVHGNCSFWVYFFLKFIPVSPLAGKPGSIYPSKCYWYSTSWVKLFFKHKIRHVSFFRAREIKMEQIFSKKTLSVLLLDKIILAVLCSNAKRLIRKRLLDSFYIFAMESTKLEKRDKVVIFYSYGVQFILTKPHPWAQGILNK